MGLSLDRTFKNCVVGVHPGINDIYTAYSLGVDTDLVVVPSPHVFAYRSERAWTVAAHSLGRAARALSRLAAAVAAASQAQANKTAAEAMRAALPPLSVVRRTLKKAKSLLSSAAVDDAAAAAVGGESLASVGGPVNVSGNASLAVGVGQVVATASGAAASGGTAAAADEVSRLHPRRRSQRKRRGPVATARPSAHAELRKGVREELAQMGASAWLMDTLCAEAMRAAGADKTAGALEEGARRRR